MIKERLELYKKIEELRGNPLIVYYTSSRIDAGGTIAGDVLDELVDQLEEISEDTQEIDLLIISNGGDPLTAYRFVSLIRSIVKKINVIVPYNAYSAATMIALGADKIIIGKYGCLGPIDPQIMVKQENGSVQAFGYEDILSYWDFTRSEVGLTEQEHIKDAFLKLGEKVEPVSLGYAKRASSLSHALGQKLLMMHMKRPEEESKAKSIVDQLNKSFFSHGHSISFKEIKDLGLNAEELKGDLEKYVWDVYMDINKEFKAREPFNPLGEFLDKDENKHYLEVPSAVNLPQIPNNQQMFEVVAKNIIQNVLEQLNTHQAPYKYEYTAAILESPRYSSRCNIKGILLVMRDSNLSFLQKNVKLSMKWEKVE